MSEEGFKDPPPEGPVKAGNEGPKVDVAKVEGAEEKKSAEEIALDTSTLEGAENFTDHYYLVTILDELTPLASSTNYLGWTSLRQSESGRNPSYLQSYFNGWDTFVDLKPHHASLLQPYFTLSLVKRDKKAARWGDISEEYPVVLQGTYAGSLNSESVLSEQYNEPVLGLKDFNWVRHAGTGDEGRKAATTAKLKLFEKDFL